VVTAYDYCDVLHKSLLFYEAQRSGRLPASNRVPWRGNSALSDCTQATCTGDGDLAGGYYDAGDGVKFLFPASFTTTTLAWGFLESEAAIDACNETQNYLDAIAWSTDFLMKAHTSELEFWGQVGNGGSDHAFWGAPELMTMARPAYKISSTAPGTELALEAASALAAASIVFKDTNAAYSASLLSHARQLYDLGYNYRGFYHDSITDAANYYKSYGYNDELVWGSSWLYRATGEESFLNSAVADYVTYNMKGSSPGQSFDWDQKSPGVLLNMYRATNDAQYLDDAQTWMNSWYQGGGVPYTPGGLAWLREWGPLRYTAGSAFLALVISNEQSNTWAQGQIDYMLGTNPQSRSYVCGYGNNPPINPHHRAAHGSTTNDINNPVNNLHILTGALVGGPGQSDDYVDSRLDYVKNEVAVDYNAAFTAAVAGLAKLSSSGTPDVIVVAPTNAPSSTRAATNGPVAPTSPPTRAGTSPTTRTTNAVPTSPRSPIEKPLSVMTSPSSSSWWFAVTILDGTSVTSKIELSDSNYYRAYVTMEKTNWGFWTLAVVQELRAPISLKITSESGEQIVLKDLIPSLAAGVTYVSSVQYGANTVRAL
jgi:endoglucanase